jgi:hypothetical protein
MTSIVWEWEPFPHSVTDGLWDDDRLREAAAEFPSPGDPSWKLYQADHESGKREGSNPVGWGPVTAGLLDDMMSMAPLLEKVTGLISLTGDTYGGGMHMTGNGGYLSMHRDFNVHPGTRMERRLNFLVYLNEEWDRNWGGSLYLGEHRDIEVLPVMNRTAIFECTPRSWHGHPDPIKGAHWRKSLACYFYGPPRSELTANSTIWLEEK